jgi:nitric oxide reductase NorD protein
VQLLLVVDRSGSGRAGLLREQQRALLGLGPALQGLDLSWSLAAFHSGGPRACAWEALKAWQEPWGSAVEERVGGLRAEGGSRLGAALREIQRQLQLRPAGRRLALLLSDGRAHDGPDYRDAQAELDTRLATAALRQSGVLFLALCLDPSAEEPATRSFGGDHLLVLRRVEELPARLPALLLRQLRPRSGWP